MGRAKRIWYLSPMRAAKVQASLRIRAVSPEPSLLAHTSSESRGTFRQKARSVAPLNGWACAVEICHDGMLEDTNSLGAAHIMKLLPSHAIDLEELTRTSIKSAIIDYSQHSRALRKDMLMKNQFLHSLKQRMVIIKCISALLTY